MSLKSRTNAIFGVPTADVAQSAAGHLERLRSIRSDEIDTIDRTFQRPEFFVPFYVVPYGQNVNPADVAEDDTGLVARNSILDLLNTFLTTAPQHRIAFVLSDSGMGKTSLLVLLRLAYLSNLVTNDLRIELLKLGSDTIARIEALPKPAQTILLLDGLDEDGVAWSSSFLNRLTELLRATNGFNKVVLTCRTQFFPSEFEEDGKRPGVVRVGGFYCSKIFLSPFDDDQVDEYISRRFDEPATQDRARLIVNKMRSLKFRPMLLSYVDDLLLHEGDYDNMYDVYEAMVEEWLDREIRKENITNKETVKEVCNRIAQKLYVSKERDLSYEDVRATYLTEDVPRLDYMTIEGRSLLHTTSEKRYKFAHYSILEFFVATMLVDPKLSFAAENTDQTKVFLVDLLKHRHKKHFRGVDLSGTEIAKAEVSSVDFAEAKLHGTRFQSCRLRRATFDKSNLADASLVDCILEKATFDGANTSRLTMAGCTISDGSLVGADLRGCSLPNCSLDGAKLDGAQFAKAELSGLKLRRSSVNQVDFQGAVLHGAILDGSTFADCNFRQSDLSGVAARTVVFDAKTSFEECKMVDFLGLESNFSECNLARIEASGADFESCQLIGAIFDRAALSGANLAKTKATSIQLQKASLPGARLDDADLSAANFNNSDLARATLQRATLTDASLQASKCDGADFRHAILKRVKFTDSDLGRSYLDYSFIEAAELSGAKLSEAQLAQAILTKVIARGIQAQEAHFNEAQIRDSDLSKSDLRHAVFNGARIAATNASSCDLTESSWRGARLERCDLRGSKLGRARLDNAHLNDVDLRNTDLRGCNFDGATLLQAKWTDAMYDSATVFPRGFDKHRVGMIGPGAHLRGVAFHSRALHGVDLTGAVVSHADISRAGLRGARFAEADLSDASLEQSDLTGADLSEANLSGTKMNGARLQDANVTSSSLRKAHLKGAEYNDRTKFPADFHPPDHGMVRKGS